MAMTLILPPDPVEAALTGPFKKCAATGGERAGGFPRARMWLAALAGWNVARKRVGPAVPEGRAPMREGVEIFDAAEAANGDWSL